MERLHDGDRDNEVGNPAIVTIPLVGTALKLACLAVALILANHIGRIYTGKTAWVGFREVDVRDAPEWSKTPFSTNVLMEAAAFQLPIPVIEGQQIVIRYRLDSETAGADAPHGRVLVTCSCPAKNWHYTRIDEAGAGELVLPVTQTAFYSTSIQQSTGPNGENSHGMYWIGVRGGTAH